MSEQRCFTLWTSDEDNYLKLMRWQGHNMVAIAQRMGRTYEAVRTRSMRLRLGSSDHIVKHIKRDETYIPNPITKPPISLPYVRILEGVHLHGARMVRP